MKQNEHIDRRNVCELLRELSSVEEQHRLWRSDGRNNAEVSSFVEAWEQLFTDTGLRDLLPDGDTGFTKEVNCLLWDLRQLLRQVNADQYPLEIINDPNMKPVREMAAAILAKLRAE